MDRPIYAEQTKNDSHEVEHLRNRVRLYLQVLLVIDLIAYISDFIDPLLIDDLTTPYASPLASILRGAVTLVTASGWAFTKFARPGRATLIAFESGVTIGLTWMYIYNASVYMTDAVSMFAPAFAMFGIILLLAVRAALVPSPVVRTVIIGVAAVVSLFVIGRDAIRALDPRVVDGVAFIGGAFVITTAITSRVIYGLRREVREALKLGQYTLEEKLGEGGMGAVYRARHAMLRREAAIKLIRPDVSREGSARTRALERFEREAHVTANLKSPHTVELYDFGITAERSFYYVMELLNGVDLGTAVATHGPMPPERVIYLLRQVCESLEEAHAVDLVHRDIKPANIFVCHHGLAYDFVKVLDFGLVALGPETDGLDQNLTADGAIAGTPGYIAPEMVTRDEVVDGRADVYAIGCVAYWLLTGRPPFERESAMATILAHVNATPIPPSAAGGGAIPAALDDIVLACLEKSPADRPASAAELSRRLDAVEIREAWNQDRAARCWEAVQRVRARTDAAIQRDATVQVTRVSR